MCSSLRLVGCTNSPPMPSKDTPSPEKQRPREVAPASTPTAWFVKVAMWALGLMAAGLLCVLMVVGVAMVIAYPNLPDISDLADYKPKLPLRVYTADGQLMGEFCLLYTFRAHETG
jgi:penicillin-binding protein 1A